MKEMMKLGLVLLLFSAISAASLALTNQATLPSIEEARKEADLENMQQVFAEADDFEAFSDEDLAKLKEQAPILNQLFTAFKGGEKVGYVAKVIPNGFGGPLEIIVGFDGEGSITGLRVGKHSETPGLGDNATAPEFYNQFQGLTLSKEIGVNKVQAGDNEVQALSAATITSEAVTTGVNELGKLLGGLE